MSTINLHRVFACPPERLYKAFLDPAALVKWMAPHGFTATIHSMDARVGGSYRMSFTNFATGQSHSFGGTYAELVPNSRIAYSDKFDDPNLQGEMSMVITFRPVVCGTELTITQANVPDQIQPEMCYLGWQESLTLLKLLVEANIPGAP